MDSAFGMIRSDVENMGSAGDAERQGARMWHGQIEGTDIIVLDPRFKN
jgi:hypothetical protein